MTDDVARRGLPIFLACLLAVLPLSAACLLEDYSVEAEFARSAEVVVAVVLSERTVPDAGSDSIGGVHYSVKVLESFKGPGKPTIVVISENSSGRFPMTVGQRYLLFLHDAGGRLTADSCGNSGVA